MIIPISFLSVAKSDLQNKDFTYKFEIQGDDFPSTSTDTRIDYILTLIIVFLKNNPDAKIIVGKVVFGYDKASNFLVITKPPTRPSNYETPPQELILFELNKNGIQIPDMIKIAYDLSWSSDAKRVSVNIFEKTPQFLFIKKPSSEKLNIDKPKPLQHFIPKDYSEEDQYCYRSLNLQDQSSNLPQ